MRTLIGLGIVLASCAACTTPVASPSSLADPSLGTAGTAAAPPVCRSVNTSAVIDGTTQNLTGLACRQPDGSWRIQQPDAAIDADAAVLPAYADYAVFPYYDPWFYGPWTFGFGGSFVFVHHFHHVDHGHFGGYGGFHNGFHHGGGFHGGGFHAGSSFHGGGRH
ncbi:hypothetical protein [Burkholderia gladioli]|uniref:hypothetical protein n=1 Tax=Burkholderia gladioli TaxID=28095 RepID=UPI000BBD35E5|nr:hypothetical protein [Burkholderia gladioli]ATF89998.1 hypothetical protein CO712_34640 [Burkholderia gladioli pv. gladioli]MBJ9712922.1 hypothetical protein [Burkholderia gladioli]MBU9153558.1 hypothetical protein [Burkholderia gladioli]MCH7270418.1 hypothetical protein [Burkholderia gladioli]MDR8092618.1 hypothetical protein [Burkholderia gladioli]